MAIDREQIIELGRKAGFSKHEGIITGGVSDLERFAALVAEKKRIELMQLFTDPENQPTQYGTVTVEHMQREIEEEREQCAKVCDEADKDSDWPIAANCAAAIRARSNT